MATKKKIDYSWINTRPPEDQISTLSNGAEFLDISVVERLLYRLDSHWGTENFKFRVFEFLGIPFVSGSLELVVTYGGRTRRLIGAYTEPVPPETNPYDPNTNANYEATVKSECTKNAVKPIGVAFGQGLNDRLTNISPKTRRAETGAKKREAAFPLPDEGVQKSYNNAIEVNNTSLANSIRNAYPEITYTGNQKTTETNAQNGMDK